MNVFVAGGTGAVGGYAVPALVGAGHQVAALARSPAKADQLRRQGAVPCAVSLFDVDALIEVLGGVDAVVNLATAIPPMGRFMSSRAWAANQRVRVEGSTAVVDAALRCGVGRVVQESVTMLYADGGEAWLDEDAPVERYPMAQGSHVAEDNARRFSAGGRTGVILRFGWFYGPGAGHSEQLLRLARHHVVMTLGDPEGYLSSIHLADAGSAIAASLSLDSGVFNVVDDQPLTKRQYADALATAAATKPWFRGPGPAARVFRDRLTSLTRSVRATNGRLKGATGWMPRYPSAREGWLAIAEEVPR